MVLKVSSVKLIQGNYFSELSACDGENLMDLLRKNGFELTAPCGGRGLCGKCLVTVVKGSVTTKVLACRTKVEGDCTVLLPEAFRGGEIMSDTVDTEISLTPRFGYGAAVDIGTTTVAIKLFDLSDGRELSGGTAWNAQGSYGADVLSRSQYTVEKPGGLALLSRLIRDQISDMLKKLCAECGVNYEAVTELYIAGNTIMQHIFASLSPASIAVAPFAPLSLFDGGKAIEIEGKTVYLAPCVAGYVGGDITAGLLATDIAKKHRKALFLDVGTNGEMALGGRDGFLSCAVACGPAFEGAGISCGMASTPGAISHVDFEDGEFKFQVIGGGTAKGICGSGLIDLMAVLLRLGLVDESGLLLPPDDAPAGFERWLDEDENGNGLLFLTDDDSVCFTAADVRQLQLAKAAVAAGISVLMNTTKTYFDDIEALYLAGGFGTHMKAESAVTLGMLPRALLGKIISVGNSSLAGAQQALLSLERRKELEHVQKMCDYLELSGNPLFNEFYPAHMSFDEEDTEWN